MKKNLIVLEINDKKYKIAKINYHSDGGFQIFAPYHKNHKIHKGYIFKARVDYRKSEFSILQENFVQEFTVSSRVKLSHHFSGFVQFSGPGIVSGLKNGKPKGAGLFSCSLDVPCHGPISGITIWGLDHFEEFKKKKKRELIIDFNKDDFFRPRKVDYTKQVSYVLELYCRPISEVLNTYMDHKKIKHYILHHPRGYILRPKVLEYNSKKMKYFLSVLCLEANSNFIGEDTGYSIGSSAEMVNEYEGDLLMCAYPHPKFFQGNYPCLDYKQQTTGGIKPD